MDKTQQPLIPNQEIEGNKVKSRKRPVATEKEVLNEDPGHRGIILEPIYEDYCLWKALPPSLLRASGEKALKEAKKLGIDDPRVLALLNIGSQKEFAKTYGITEQTCVDWNKTIAKRDILADIRQWALPLTREVVKSMQRNALQTGFTSHKDRELFFKVINQFNDKLDVKHSVDNDLASILKRGLKSKQTTNANNGGKTN